MHPDNPWEDADDKVVPIGRASRRAREKVMAQAPRSVSAVKPQLGLDDIFVLLLRELWLMAAIFACIFAVGLMVALNMPSTYSANAILLMQLGKDYVYNPTTDDAARGATATIDNVVQAEVAILSATELKRRVIAKVGYETVLPDSPSLWHPRTDDQKADSDSAALRVMQSGFSVSTAPQNGVVQLSFKHANARSASIILNALIDEYQTYRRDKVYQDDSGPALEKERDAFDAQLATADQAYQQFLADNGVGDFDAAKATYSKIYDTAMSNLYDTQAQIATDVSKLGEVDNNIASLAPEISTERDLDLTVPSKIFALKEQRQELLSRYQPTAQPVKDLDAQIASLQALMNSGSAIGEQSHKLGANPVYQDAVTQKLNLEAELSSLRGREKELQGQVTQITGKLQGMTGLEAQYNNLASERDALQSNIKTFTQKIQENNATRDMAKSDDDVVRVVEKAGVPEKPKSFRRVVLILSFLFAGFTALCAGLLKVYTRKGFVNADMASRALDLPVLATATRKAA